MSIFTQDETKETLVKAIVVRVDKLENELYEVLCMLGNSDTPLFIQTSRKYIRDGDYIEIRKIIVQGKDSAILNTTYEIEKNVSLADECRYRKQELLEVLGIN